MSLRFLIRPNFLAPVVPQSGASKQGKFTPPITQIEVKVLLQLVIGKRMPHQKKAKSPTTTKFLQVELGKKIPVQLIKQEKWNLFSNWETYSLNEEDHIVHYC